MKLLLFLMVVTLLYGYCLQTVPVHLNQDELGFSLNAYSIAQSGFDENGRFLPLYFWHLGVMWATPIIVYLTSFFLLFLPLSEITVRIPSLTVGLIDIILIYLISQKIFNEKKYALFTAIVLALTPAHFIHSRILLDNLFIVPFVLGWFYLLILFEENRRVLFVFLSASILGLGVHSYHAAKVMMPLYLLMTLIATFRIWIKNPIFIVAIVVGFVMPLLPLIPWLSQYPDTLIDQVKYTGLYDTKLNPLQGMATLLNGEIISQKLYIWLKYFNPRFLFLIGDASLIHSTQKAGVFLLSYSLLIPFGIYQIIKSQEKWFGLIILVCFLTAPIAPALVGNEYRISKALVMLPFASLIATYGFWYLFHLPDKIKICGISIIVIITFLQFGYFVGDYFTDYPKRSYGWFNYNISGALEGLIIEDANKHQQSIYLDNQILFMNRYWKFYLIKNHRLDLLDKTNYYLPVTSDNLFLYRFDHVDIHQMAANQKIRQRILEPDGTVSFYILGN